MELHPAGVIGTIVVLVFSFVSLFLFIACFDTVKIDEYGLLYNTYLMHLENEPRAPGRFFLGLGKEFIKFPRELQDFEFKDSGGDSQTLTCWSNNGLNVYIELSFYYLLRPENLAQFYLEFGSDWPEMMLRISQAGIKDTTISFSTQDYFEERITIKEAIYSNVDKDLYEKSGGTIQLVDLQLRRITFDASFEIVLADKLIALQNLRTYEIRMETEQILKEIELIEQDATNQITILNYNQEAAGILLTENAEASAFSQVIQQMATSYADLNAQLDMDPGSDLLHFIFANELQNMFSDSMQFSFGVNKVIMQI